MVTLLYSHRHSDIPVHHMGPPTADALRQASAAIASPAVSGLVIDLRDAMLPRSAEGLQAGLVKNLAHLRMPLWSWMMHLAARPRHVCPIAILVKSTAEATHLEDLAARWYDCPSLWFSTGFEILPDPKGADSVDGAFEGALAALERLRAHPLVDPGPRGEELFGELSVDSLGERREAFARPWHVQDKARELRVVVTSTYQLAGGTATLLPTGLTDMVLRHVLVGLTAEPDHPRAPTGASGVTMVEGSGAWYSSGSWRFVEERVRVAIMHLRISEREVQSLARYLRLAWLQDCVFCTLDGRVVEA